MVMEQMRIARDTSVNRQSDQASEVNDLIVGAAPATSQATAQKENQKAIHDAVTPGDILHKAEEQRGGVNPIAAFLLAFARESIPASRTVELQSVDFGVPHDAKKHGGEIVVKPDPTAPLTLIFPKDLMESVVQVHITTQNGIPLDTRGALQSKDGSFTFGAQGSKFPKDSIVCIECVKGNIHIPLSDLAKNDNSGPQ